MKKALGILLLMISLMAVVNASAEAGPYAAGVYQAEARGRNGMVSVETTLSTDAITGITVLNHVETAGICEVAFDSAIRDILQNQSLTVDTVTGATMSRNAIVNAVSDCVKQAGGNPDDLKIARTPVEITAEPIELEADVLVVGAGLSGVCAAEAAAQQGAKVIILEKCAYVGGNSRLSSGAFHLGATDLQASVGIDDNVESVVADMLAYAQSQGGSRREEAVRMVAENGNATLNWLIGDCGIVFSDNITAGMGDAVPRFTRATDGMKTLFDTMLEDLQTAGVELRLETAATALLQDNDGAVTGVTAVDKNGQVYTIHAKETILAAGGYRANEKATVEYTGYAGLTYCGAPGATGEMLANAILIGAATEYLEVPYLSPTYNKASLTALTSIMLSKGGILLNEEGTRFCDETRSYRAVALSILDLGQKDNQVIEVLDNHLMEKEPSFVNKYISLGIVDQYESIEEICNAYGWNAEATRASIDEMNRAIRGEKEDEFGRVIWGEEFGASPFYVIKVGPGGNISGGGLLTNDRCQVLRTDGSILQNLYAVGETSGAGGIRAWGYAGGDALAFCAVSGRMAGITAAEACK